MAAKTLKLPVEIRAALSISHGSLPAHAGRRTLKRVQKERNGSGFVRESLTFRRSAGGSESKSLSSSLDVDSLMTAHWTCLMYQTVALFDAPDETPEMVFLTGKMLVLAAMRLIELARLCSK